MIKESNMKLKDRILLVLKEGSAGFNKTNRKAEHFNKAAQKSAEKGEHMDASEKYKTAADIHGNWLKRKGAKKARKYQEYLKKKNGQNSL